ncbi:MAG: hypothetical protein ACR2F6_06150 [Mycobacteriales bacterium]
MPVLMTMRVTADGTKAEESAAANRQIYAEVLETSKRHGMISHHFYASDTEVMVLDQWPSEEACNAFVAEAQPKIAQIMAGMGVSSEPAVTFWRVLDMGDDVG